MPTRTILTIAAVALFAACTPKPEVAAPSPSMPASVQPAPAGQPGGVWDVTRVTCANLLNAADDDRAAAMMFYYGYLAAQANITMIDVSKIDGNVHRVVDQCTQRPDLTVPQAFDVAFGRAPRS